MLLLPELSITKFMKSLSSFMAANPQFLSEGGLAAGSWGVVFGAGRVECCCGGCGLRISWMARSDELTLRVWAMKPGDHADLL